VSRTPKHTDVLSEQLVQYLSNARTEWELVVSVQASPIEKVFVGEMFQCLWRMARGRDDAYAVEVASAAGLEPDPKRPHWSVDPNRYLIGLDDEAVCVTQPYMTLRERRIRPDLAFVLPGEFATKVIVELDGHDFHERTPGQAQSDKSRDRELQSMGWHVLRFTGREVLRHPAACLDETSRVLFAKRMAALGQTEP
jgi:hypothetical protein